MKNYTDKQLLDHVKSLPSFGGLINEHWCIIARSQADNFNVPDDKFYVFKGDNFIDVMPCTSNSGKDGLLNFDNPLGCGVIKADEWYYHTFARGRHKGKMDAWIQNRGLKIIRDNNKNKISGDINAWSWEYAKGFNIHTDTYETSENILSKAYKYVQSKLIGKWSYGCIVIFDRVKYHKFLQYTKEQSRLSVCLINEF